MLDLSLILWKYLFILAAIRLVSSAFGIEFGVSRQYLRIIEFIFFLGKKRIDKVESRARFALSSESADLIKDEEDSEELEQAKRQKVTTNEQETAKRPDQLSLDRSRNSSVVGSPISNKMRRIPTADGPPIFLLDDDDDDDLNGNPSNSFDSIESLDSRDPLRHEFHLADISKLVVKGIEAIVDDQVTKRFSKEELKTWNLLTRTNARNYQFMSGRLGLYWFLGFLFRYAFLIPLRLTFFTTGLIWMFFSMSFVGLLPEKYNIRHRVYCLISLMSFRMLSCALTSRLEFHNGQYKAQRGDVCVANHTSPLDALILSCDNSYALVGQRHGGVLGIFELILSRAANHVWFDRGEMRDRLLVTRRLKEHVDKKCNLPVLIFPEGTCINNSAVMLFRKGTFETTNRVCPVAIKYDPRFGDLFWNSSKQSYGHYLSLVASSWAIKCDVWYLPPMEKLPDETAVAFANRVKSEIARQGGLADLAWDGQLKRQAAKEIWRHQQQEDFARRLKLY